MSLSYYKTPAQQREGDIGGGGGLPPGAGRGGGHGGGVTPPPATPPPTSTGGGTPAPPTLGQTPGVGASPSPTSNIFGASPAQMDPTLGSGSFPWLQGWQGGYQAPMSQQQNDALGGISGMASQGFGLGGEQNYLNSLMGGNWLDVANNPYFQQIQNSGQQLLNTQESRGLQQLQSSAAAGGNALSGGLLQNENDFMRNSNAAFGQMMGQLMANQYSQERGYMNQAPGMQNALTNTALGGLGQEMNMGSVPQQLGTQEMQGQYNDWLRQIQALQSAYQYPDQGAMAMLGSGGYRQTYTPTQASDSSGGSQIAQILAMLGGNSGISSIDWGSILNSLGLGGSGGGGDTTTSPSGNFDAHPVHYDATQPPTYNPFAGSQPTSYQNASWYNNALNQESNARQQQMQQPYQGLSAGLGSAGLIMALLKLLAPSQGGAAKSPGMGMGGGGGSPKGGAPGAGVPAPPGDPSNPDNNSNPFGAFPTNTTGTSSGLTGDNSFGAPAGADPFSGSIDPANYGFPDPYTGGNTENPQQNQSLADFLNSYNGPTGYGTTQDNSIGPGDNVDPTPMFDPSLY